VKHQKSLAKALVWMILGALGVWLGFCVFIVLVGLCMFLAMYWKVLVFVAFICALAVLTSWMCTREAPHRG
jgi:hypothetical protein